MRTSKKVSIISIKQVREKSVEYEQRCMRDSKNAMELFKTFIGDCDREAFIVAYLNNKNHINSIQIISIGTLSASLVHPREVFKGAMTSNAAAILACHNHPSGNPLPSEEDDKLTDRLVKCCEIMGIPILDHIILGNSDQYYSYKDVGRIS